jgi:predicted phosphoribosyltransferase
LKGRTVILVDDGIATGATFYASLGALVKDEVGRLVAAVPVAPSHAMTELRMLVDERVVLHTSEWFFGISRFYERFPLVEDDEVVACLEAACVALSGREQTPA